MTHPYSPVQRSRFWSAFGPGLLWAATAIGISHLVQSTRAGALAGFGLSGVILLALGYSRRDEKVETEQSPVSSSPEEEVARG